MAVTGICVIYNYGFWITTLQRLFSSKINTPAWSSQMKFFGADFLFMNLFPWMAAIAILIWALVEYVRQNLNYTQVAFDVLSPQDVANLLYLALGMMVLGYHKMYQISQYSKFNTAGYVEDTSGATRASIFFAVMVPLSALVTICLFGGVYGYLQAGTHQICSHVPVTWFALGAYPNYYSNVPAAHLATGIILAANLMWRFYRHSTRGQWKELVSYQPTVFDVVYSPSQTRSMLIGWFPTLHLGFWWTIAFSWFFGQAHIFHHHDLYKALGVWFCTSFLSLILSAVSGSVDSFSSFFFASVFTFELIQYVSGGVLKPIDNTEVIVLSQQTVDFGLYLTGPAAVLDVDPTTVTAFTYVGLSLATLAVAMDYMVGPAKATPV